MKNMIFVGQPNYCVSMDGKIFSLKSNRFLKPFSDTSGYQYIECYENGQKHKFSVHRLVAKAFICNDLNKKEVNHKDGNKENNSVGNLEWVTPSENCVHAERTGLRNNAKLTDEQVHNICSKLSDGFRNSDIADMFGVPKSTVSEIKNKKAYKYISDEYDFSKVKRDQRICVETVIHICELLQQGTGYAAIEEATGANKRSISCIKRGIYFTEVSKNYKFN